MEMSEITQEGGQTQEIRHELLKDVPKGSHSLPCVNAQKFLLIFETQNYYKDTHTNQRQLITYSGGS